MKLVTFDEGRVGSVKEDKVVELEIPSLRAFFEAGQAPRETGEVLELDRVRLRAPIVPKKFFHTAGNFREHEEESRRVNWSHEIAPWIVFFQNIDAIVGPDEPVIYPEHLTEELDYELELAVVIRKAGKWFSPEEAMDYVGGYVIFNDITARDIQRREMRSGVFSFCKAIDTFCPLGPWIVTADEISDPHDLAHGADVDDDPRDSLPLLGAGLQCRRRRLDRHGLGGGRVQRGCGIALPEAGRRHGVRDREHRCPPQPRHLLAGGARGARASARPLVAKDCLVVGS